MKTFSCALVCLAMLLAPGGVVAAPDAAAGSRYITKAQYGKRWPFTVQAGILACQGPGAVTFTTRGVRYAVNGTARMMKLGPKVDRIWRNDPAYPGTGLKVNIGPIIDRGLSLC